MRNLQRGAIVMMALGAMAATPASAAPAAKDREEVAIPEVKVIGRYTEYYGLQPFRVDNVGLVVGLKGTGSNPAPSQVRARLIDTLRRRNFSDEEVQELLASPDTAIVLLRAFIPFGAREGDRVDVEVMVPRDSETTSLRGGWLLETSLSQTMRLGRRIRDGDIVSVAKGPIVVSTEIGEKNGSGLDRRGRILGGATLRENRDLLIVLADRYESVKRAVHIQNVINRRFHGVPGALSEGVAKAKNDEYIELKVEERYRHNVARYLEVIRQMAVDEPFPQRHNRLAQLERYLLSEQARQNSGAVIIAALQLEGMGNEGKPVLQRVLEQCEDEEIRFYMAEALAYLGEASCVPELQRHAREEPAHRVFALAALASLRDPAATTSLVELMDGPSAELRYGAFRALWTIDPDLPLLEGRNLDGQFSLHAVATQGPPMLHATWSTRPEIVLFGQDQRLLAPLFLQAGSDILVQSTPDGTEAIIQRLAANRAPEQRRCSLKLQDVVENVVALRGNYTDVVEMLAQAERQHNLQSRLCIDAIPRAGRVSAKGRRLLEQQQVKSTTGILARLPNLFGSDSTQPVREKPGAASKPPEDEQFPDEDAEDKPPAKRRAFLGKLFGRSSR